MNTELLTRRLAEDFMTFYPGIVLGECLGGGNHGKAYRFNKTKAIKFTLDEGEIRTCSKLVARDNRFLCNIEKVGGQFYSEYADQKYTWIIEELLHPAPDGLSIKQSLKDFRHAWFTLYCGFLGNLDYYQLQRIYASNDSTKIQRTKTLLYKYIRNINDDEYQDYILSEYEVQVRLKNSLRFFDFVSDAYHELISICPLGRIDLNEGNFMIDDKGNLKVLDFQSAEV